MKKTYIEPSVEIGGMTPESLICASQASLITSEIGIFYGGMDEDGGKDPASRLMFDVWGEDGVLW